MNRLTIGDGFQFGCGFMFAGCLSWVVLVIVFMVVSGLLTLLGLGGALSLPQLPIPGLGK
jgi:hypothetical protein